MDPWVGKISWRRERLPTAVFWALLGGPDGKESTCSVGDLGSIPGSGGSPGDRKGYPLQYSCLENPMDRGIWRTAVCGVTGLDVTNRLSTAQHGGVSSALLNRRPAVGVPWCSGSEVVTAGGSPPFLRVARHIWRLHLSNACDPELRRSAGSGCFPQQSLTCLPADSRWSVASVRLKVCCCEL